mgnify:CR=1 FL=1
MSKKLAVLISPRYSNEYALTKTYTDLSVWTEELRTRGYQVAARVGSNATHSNVSQALSMAVASLQPFDRLVVVFTGLGTWVPRLDQKTGSVEGRARALCPTDFDDNGRLLTNDFLHSIFSMTPRLSTSTLFVDAGHEPLGLTPGALTGAVNPVRQKALLVPPTDSELANVFEDVAGRFDLDPWNIGSPVLSTGKYGQELETGGSLTNTLLGSSAIRTPRGAEKAGIEVQGASMLRRFLPLL